MGKRKGHSKKSGKKRKQKGGRLTGRRIKAVGRFIMNNKDRIIDGLQKTQIVSKGLTALANTGRLGSATPMVTNIAKQVAQRGYGLYLPTRSGRGRSGMSGYKHKLV